MTDDFVNRGMPLADAQIVVAKLAQNENLFVDMVLTEEIGYRSRNEDDEYILSDAFVMFVSHVGFGLLPLLVLAASLLQHNAVPIDVNSNDSTRLYFGALATAYVLLFILGAMKGMHNRLSWLCTGIEAVFLGVVGSLVAYFAARLCWSTYME